MEFKINIDTGSMEKKLQETLTSQLRDSIEKRSKDFFNVQRKAGTDEKGKWIIITEKGDGIKEIDEMIANKFLDPKFQESMQKFFDHNWERIFEECMIRALQHKANGIAFNKMHDLPPMKGTQNETNNIIFYENQKS